MNVMTVQRSLLKNMKLFFINVQIYFLEKEKITREEFEALFEE